MFIREMNRYCFRNHMYSTKFTNPHGLQGLEEDSSHKSTSYDIAVLSNLAMENPIFAKIANEVQHKCDIFDS